MHNLQVPGQVVSLLTRHLGFPIPSPAILEKIGLRFRKEVAEYARDNDVPVIRFAKGDRKLDCLSTATSTPLPLPAKVQLLRLKQDLERRGFAMVMFSAEDYLNMHEPLNLWPAEPDGANGCRGGHAGGAPRVAIYRFPDSTPR